MDTLRDSFLSQFSWEPAVVGAAPAAARVLVGGMGGSHLAADLLSAAAPELGISTHHDYGLPAVPEGALAIAVSHSGNTEETLDFLRAARERGLPCAAISLGGRLIEYALAENIPHVVLPHSPLSPRASVGYHAVALLALLGRAQELAALRGAAASVGADAALAAQAQNAPMARAMPLVYSSQKNAALARYMKIQFNETSKAPAFSGAFPELNHNEMIATLEGGADARVILLRDQSDDPRVIKRMDVFAALAQERGVAVENIAVPAEPLKRLVAVALLAQERARALALERGADPDDTRIIEEFKKRIA
jgi:glucose/mannose-6-phosphate isomerase